jgi:hypothetical protein
MVIDPTPFYEDLNKPNGEVKPGRPRLGLIPFADIRPGDDPPYLVKGVIPREGEPKSGKSFQSFDLAMAVARGIDYRDRGVQQGPVVYCAAEGATGFRNRVEAYRQHHELEGEPLFYLVPDALSLVDDAAELVASIRTTLGDTKPFMVVLDTLNRSLAGNENDPGDMAAYIKAADLIREAFGCAVLIVHHCGVDSKRPRGHTSLTGAADAQLAVKRAGETIVTTVEWMKDGPEGESLYSILKVMTVGQDSDGEDITSCVVLEADTPAVETRQRSAKLTPNQQTMLTVLQEAMPDGLTIENWNEQAKDAGLCEGQKGQRRRFYDLRTQLKRKKLVHETQGRWYITTR